MMWTEALEELRNKTQSLDALWRGENDSIVIVVQHVTADEVPQQFDNVMAAIPELVEEVFEELFHAGTLTAVCMVESALWY